MSLAGTRRWPDLLIAGLLAVLAGAAALAGEHRIPAALSLQRDAYDLWFEGDLPRVYALISTRWPDPRYHTRRHPMFILALLPFSKAAQVVLGLNPLDAVRLVMSLVAALWLAALFLLLRLSGCRRLDAALFSVLASVSAGAVFWFSVPETWGLGSVSLLVPLVLLAWARDRHVSAWWYTAASAASLSITVTNWMAGIITTFVRWPWRRAIRMTAGALCLVTLLWGAEKLLLPRIQFFMTSKNNARYLFQKDSGGPVQITNVFVFHSMVMPSITEHAQSNRPGTPTMNIQIAAPGSATLWGRVAVWLWAALLGLGAWGARAAARRQRTFTLALMLTLLGQYAFHLAYGGEETFLYSLHWIPLLIVVASWSTLTRARPLALVLAGMLVVCVAVNNTRQFSGAVAFAQQWVQRVAAQDAGAAAPPAIEAIREGQR